MQPDNYFELIQNSHDLQNLTVTAPADWGQGRTVFGGLSAGIIYQVLKKLVPEERVLRSITFNFVGPIDVGTPFGFQWQILREGKNATQITAHIIQNDQICLTALGCFALDRDSDVNVKADSISLAKPKSTTNTIKCVPGVTPEFIQHVDILVEKGAMPFSASNESSYEGWMKFKQSPKALTDAHILTLIDAWPPTILQMSKGFAPASTMSWNVEFIHPHQKLEASTWLAYRAKTVQANGGYGHTEAQVFNESGELVAISRQLIAIFDRK
tara:strand:- start:8984 stop:9793 length:810 start_codon:yes stop_codon:yes gene_type:complete